MHIGKTVCGHKRNQANSDMPHGSLMATDKINTAETVFFYFLYETPVKFL